MGACREISKGVGAMNGKCEECGGNLASTSGECVNLWCPTKRKGDAAAMALIEFV